MVLTRIDRYLFRVLAKGALVVLLPLMALETLLNFVHEARHLDQGQTIGELVWLSMHRLPIALHDFLPIAVFIGGLLGLGNLLAHGEMTAAFAVGYSRRRLGVSLMASGGFFVLLTAALGEYVVPIQEKTISAMQSSRAHAVWQSDSPFSEKWMRLERYFVYAHRADPGGVYHDLKLYHLAEDGRLIETIRARRMESEHGQYLAKDVDRARIAGDRLVFSTAAQLNLASLPMAGELMVGGVVPPPWMSARQLWHYVQFLQDSGLRHDIHRMAMWFHLAHPLTIPALLFLLLPFVFIGRSRRGQNLFLGVIVGVIYSILVRSFSGVALVYHWPAWVGAFLPLLVVLATAWLLLVLRKPVAPGGG